MKKATAFETVFAHRATGCFFLIMFLFLFSILRVTAIATGNYAAVQEKQSSYRLRVIRPRSTIYDCNMLPLNNCRAKTVAAVAPIPQAIASISSALSGKATLSGVLSRLSTGKPVLCEVDRPINCDGIVCIRVPIHEESDQSAAHLIGYTDQSGHGVSGLEAAYDDLLYCEETVDAVFHIDGAGRVLEGVKAEFTEDRSRENALLTTLDADIQTAAETAAASIEKGAVAVCDANTGEIRAMVSRPDFDCTDIAPYLERTDSPLLNRALAAYNVGSVFKPCVAAAGLEKGLSDFCINCTGTTQIADRVFKCHKHDGHGMVTLKEALAFSCNSFFYRFSAAIGASPIYKTASALGFGTTIRLAPGITSAAGSLTPESELKNPAALANLSIGQGKLLLSPVAMLSLYCAIASDGRYCLPTVVRGTVENGKTVMSEPPLPTRMMSQKTAATLREYLAGVIRDGTGRAAAPTLCTAAGKTATAQTGRHDENGQEITVGWFCGFFPAEDPAYVAVVMIENAGGTDAAPVFSALADGIMTVKKQ